MNTVTHEPRLNYLPCPDKDGSHRMAYWEWGDWGNVANPHVVICVHGLSRQGRDFDVLARALMGEQSEHGQRCRVICPYVAGRGHSDWLKDPMGYQVPQYAGDMLLLLATLRQQGTQTIDWVGTSMGGLIGMAVAAQPGAGIGKLVLNDVGPAVQWDALQRIKSYVGAAPTFATEQAGIDALWQLSVSFGPHTAEEWLALSRPMLRQSHVDGVTQYRLHYDPNIAVPVRAATQEMAAQGEAMLWQAYDSLRCPTLVTRGAESDLLSPATAKAMQERGPKARLVEFAGVGHAPTLVADDQVAAVASFLFA